MLFRTVLVDDEYWTLELIRHIFPWEAYGFTVEASFTDAVVALKYILSSPVDLVVTDIRMPGFSGLDLLKEYRRSGGEAEFIIISGYSEFEYARTALQGGAVDYCLKPIKKQEAEAVLTRVREVCLRRREARSRVVMELLEEQGGFEKALGTLGSALTADHLLCVVTLQAELPQALLDGHPALHSFVLCGGRNKWVYLFGGSPEALAELDAALETAASASGAPRIGVSRIIKASEATPGWFHGADMAAHCGFVDPLRRFERFDPSIPAQMGVAVRAFSLALGSRDEKMIMQVMGDIPAMLRRGGLGLYHTQNLYNRIVAVAQNLLGDSPALEVRGYDELLESYASAEQVFQELALTVTQMMRDSSSATPEAGDSFFQILEYVRAHYNQKLSIKMLADRFYMNSTYLCELFHRKTGHTFNEYVTTLRMQHAADQIRAGKATLQEIADEVGYNDYFYFSKAFKKYYALSPSAYAKKTQPAAATEE